MSTVVISSDGMGGLEVEYAPPGIDVVLINEEEFDDVYDMDSAREAKTKAQEILLKLNSLPEFGDARPPPPSRKQELVEQMEQALSNADERIQMYLDDEGEGGSRRRRPRL